MNRTCPHCNGANVRRSSTPAGEVTWRNQFFSRYRCRDCMLQFWVISQKTYVATLTLVAAILVAALAVFVVGIVFNPEESAPGRRRSDAMPLPNLAAHLHHVVAARFAATFITSQRSQT